MMSLLDNKVSGSSLSKYAFTYDVLGNITELTDNAEALNGSNVEFKHPNPRAFGLVLSYQRRN
jgi:hypothetical protein